jgi:hypothetical protein
MLNIFIYSLINLLLLCLCLYPIWTTLTSDLDNWNSFLIFSLLLTLTPFSLCFHQELMIYLKWTSDHVNPFVQKLAMALFHLEKKKAMSSKQAPGPCMIRPHPFSALMPPSIFPLISSHWLHCPSLTCQESPTSGSFLLSLFPFGHQYGLLVCHCILTQVSLF